MPACAWVFLTLQRHGNDSKLLFQMKEACQILVLFAAETLWSSAMQQQLQGSVSGRQTNLHGLCYC